MSRWSAFLHFLQNSRRYDVYFKMHSILSPFFKKQRTSGQCTNISHFILTANYNTSGLWPDNWTDGRTDGQTDKTAKSRLNQNNNFFKKIVDWFVPLFIQELAMTDELKKLSAWMRHMEKLWPRKKASKNAWSIWSIRNHIDGFAM